MIKNKPYKQIVIYDNKLKDIENEVLRAKIFRIIKGYIYYEKIDKSGKTTHDCL